MTQNEVRSTQMAPCPACVGPFPLSLTLQGDTADADAVADAIPGSRQRVAGRR